MTDIKELFGKSRSEQFIIDLIKRKAKFFANNI
jgi:hypothetical protein